MVKGKFTSTDVAAMVASVRPHIVGARVANVYDIAGKLFLIKFTSSLVVAEEDEGKATLLMEAGVRFHLTTFERKKAAIPSGWTMNLRKLLKGKQLERIDQIGCDRVVVMQFGLAERAIFVILELYAKGNVVVTDCAHKVQLLLRSHTFESGSAIAKNEIYPLAEAASVLEPAKTDWNIDPSILEILNAIDVKSLRNDIGKRKKRNLGPSLSQVERLIAKIIPFAHSGLILTALTRTEGADTLSWVSAAVDFALNVWNEATSLANDAGFVGQGEFAPLESLLPPGEVKSFPSFSSAVDEFFQAIETSGDQDRVEAQRAALTSKVEKIRIDQQRRISELELEQQSLWEQAELLESNLELADAAIAIINALIGKQMTWNEISATMVSQSAAGHPVASKVGRIDFQRNRFELVLAEATSKTVWLELGLNATGNVSALHIQRKQQKEKLAKTEEQAALAIRTAESKLKQDLSKFNDSVERSRHLAKVRKRFWFERFYWCITSEGFLVIAGRDATQNEAIYKKYLKSRDAYVHADIHGAATVVVKSQGGDIPPLSLAEAGQFSLCHSSAWNSKIVTSAWWVRADQVSKTAPTGEYLTTGSFMIRGRKNFLPPTRLELGIGVLFVVSDDTARGRLPERVIRSQATEGDVSQEEIGGGLVSIVESVQASKKKPSGNKSTSPETGKGVDSVASGAKGKALTATVEARETGSIDKGATGGKGQAAKGRKGKKKASKYEFDDDLEDEKIRRKLLGIGVGGDENVVNKEQSVEEQQGLESKAPMMKNCYVCGSEDHLAADCPVKLQRSGKKSPIVVEEEEIAETEQTGDQNVLQRLVGTVGDNDELIHAIPVCGPYSALSCCQLKAKIVPGSMKRGKAAKLCSGMFGSSQASSVSVKKLVKLIPVEEFSECLVNDVKIAAAGVTKLQVDTKKLRKQVAKQKGVNE